MSIWGQGESLLSARPSSLSFSQEVTVTKQNFIHHHHLIQTNKKEHPCRVHNVLNIENYKFGTPYVRALSSFFAMQFLFFNIFDVEKSFRAKIEQKALPYIITLLTIGVCL